MIHIKNKSAIEKMKEAGRRLSSIFCEMQMQVVPGVSTLAIDGWIEKQLFSSQLVSKSKGYYGYAHVSCISVNDVVVHGVPKDSIILSEGDIVKVDVCASWSGYCADMARTYFVGRPLNDQVVQLVRVAQSALDAGIEKARLNNRLSDISSAIQNEIDKYGFGIIQDFAGHGIGKQMHEEPDVLNYGVPGEGPRLLPGMAFAIEPMITMGHHDVYIAEDNWTVKTIDKSLAAHVEDTVIVTQDGPLVITR